MRRRFATVGLCLLLVLSGCSALSGGGESGPPGIEDGRLADAGALLETHEATLTEGGYGHDVTVNQTRAVDGERVEERQRQRTHVAAGASEYLRQVVFGGRFSGRIVAWGNESVEYQRVESAGETQYRRASPESATAMSGADFLEPHLSAPMEVVDRETADGRTLVTLEATGRPADGRAFPRNATDVGSYDAQVVVDGEGRVHRLSASAEYELDGEPGEYELAYELTSLSDPGIERPGWVEGVEA